jgi:hypothetical protein
VIPGVLVTAAMIAALRIDHPPLSDLALLELRVRDVPDHLPLTGAFSRYGWDHPGPYATYWLAPFYRVLGWRGLWVGTVVLSAAWMAASTWFLARVLPLWRVLTFQGAVAIYVAAMGAERLAAAWNPYLTVLPLVLLAACVLAAWEGDRWALLGGVVAASAVAQSHVGAAPVALALGACLVVVLVRRLGVWDVVHARTTWIAVGVGVLFWLPPLLDQVAGRGNLHSIVDFALSSDEPSFGLRRGAGAVLHAIGPEGMWRDRWGVYDSGLLEFASGAGPLPWLAPLLFAGAVALAWKRGDWWTMRLAVVAGLSVAGGVVATAAIRGTPMPYLVEWLSVPGGLLWLTVAWAAGDAAAARAATRDPRPATAGGSRRGAVAAIAVAAAIAVPAVAVSMSERGRPFYRDDVGVASQLAAEITPTLEGQTVSVCWIDPYFGSWAFSFLTALEREGGSFRQPFLAAHIVGDHRWQETLTEPTISVAAGLQAIDRMEELGGVRLAVADPLTPEERARERELSAVVDAALRASGASMMDHLVLDLALGVDLQAFGDARPALRDLPEMQELVEVRGATPVVAVYEGCLL